MEDKPRVDAETLDSDELLAAPPERLHPALERSSVDSEDADERQELGEEQSSKEDIQPSPADIESKFEQRIRETEERLANQFGSLIERVNKSNRDATRARFDELKVRVDELYHVQAAGLDELVAAGKLDATDAAVQKLQWRDKYERQALAEARQFAQHQPTAEPIVQALSAQRDWETRKRDILQALDLTGGEPEYLQLMAQWDANQAHDVESAASQYRALAKQVRKQVDARVLHGRSAAETQTPLRVAGSATKRPPMIESGGDGSGHVFDAQKELERLIEKGPPDDPRKATRYLKRLEELEASLE